MTFPGTELLEVAPDNYFAVGSGGGKVFAIGGGYSGASGYAAIMDTTTGASLLYSIPVYYGALGISAPDEETVVTATVQVARVRGGSPVDVLSTAITVDASETSSYTAATAPVINTSNDDVLTGDFLRVDIDGAGTGAKGLIVMVTLQPV